MKVSDFENGDGVCIGGFKAVDIVEVSSEFAELDLSSNEFICINPIDHSYDFGHKEKPYYNQYVPRRADVNVSEFRNFLFEMDSTDLDTQLKILENSKIPFYKITYSGSKSYHAILALKEGLNLPVNDIEGVFQYKNIWKRLQAYIDLTAIAVGFELPDGKTSFIDPSCKNPSRLTRMGDSIRNNGNLQKIHHIGEKMSIIDFEDLLNQCPNLDNKVKNVVVSDFSINSTEDFWKLCPVGLKNKLKYVDWAGSEGMYPELLKLTYWAIDSTGVDKDTFLDILWDRTFLKLIEAGYPESKLKLAINDAYNDKRRSNV